jgi:hypothetical protein
VTDREFWLAVRMALLAFVDAIERRWGFERTSDLRSLLRKKG